jgi:hypothetical protein
MPYLPKRGLGATPTPPASIQTALQNASNMYGVPVSLLQSVAYAESGYNPTAKSSAGAQGLMQIMPANNASLGISNPFDPQQSANAGAQYLSQLYAQYGDWNTALIAYNEGPGNLASKGPFASSQSYASGILANAGDLSSSPVAGTTLDASTGLPAADPGGFDLTTLFSPSVSDGSGSISLVDSTGSLTGWGIAALAAVAGAVLLAVAL